MLTMSSFVGQTTSDVKLDATRSRAHCKGCSCSSCPGCEQSDRVLSRDSGRVCTLSEQLGRCIVHERQEGGLPNDFRLCQSEGRKVRRCQQNSERAAPLRVRLCVRSPQSFAMQRSWSRGCPLLLELVESSAPGQWSRRARELRGSARRGSRVSLRRSPVEGYPVRAHGGNGGEFTLEDDASEAHPPQLRGHCDVAVLTGGTTGFGSAEQLVSHTWSW